MSIRELFCFKAQEGDDIYVKANGSVWEGVLFDIDRKGITIAIDSTPYWISFDDFEVWGRNDVLKIELNGVEQVCSY